MSITGYESEHKPVVFSWLVVAIVTLALAGVAISGYALYLHYAPATSFCNISGWFSCDTVNKGPYSELFGIPVALLGILGYAAVGTLTLLRRFKLAALSSTAGLLFALYLTSLEAFVIFSFCLVCLASQFVILVLTIFVWFAVRVSGKKLTK